MARTPSSGSEAANAEVARLTSLAHATDDKETQTDSTLTCWGGKPTKSDSAIASLTKAIDHLSMQSQMK